MTWALLGWLATAYCHGVNDGYHTDDRCSIDGSYLMEILHSPNEWQRQQAASILICTNWFPRRALEEP